MGSIFFDRLTRLLGDAPSRRTLGGACLGMMTTLISPIGPDAVEAHNPLPACRKIVDKKQRQRCLRRARRHNRLNHCPRGRANCDDRRANRCETNIRNNVNHCGGCGIVCTGPDRTTVLCRNGRCGFVKEIQDSGGDGFTIPAPGTITVEALGAAGGRGGRGGIASIGTGSGGVGGSGGRGAKVTATFDVAAGDRVSLRTGRAGEDGGDANGETGGSGADTAAAGSDGDDGTNGTLGSGGGGGGGCGGGLSSVRWNEIEIIAGGGGGGAGGGGAGRGGTGDGLTQGGPGGGGGTGEGLGTGGEGGLRGLGGAGGGGDGQPGFDGFPGTGRIELSGGMVQPGVNPGTGRVKVTFIAAKPGALARSGLLRDHSGGVPPEHHPHG